jgi:hypothetical protein
MEVGIELVWRFRPKQDLKFYILAHVEECGMYKDN